MTTSRFPWNSLFHKYSHSGTSCIKAFEIDEIQWQWEFGKELYRNTTASIVEVKIFKKWSEHIAIRELKGHSFFEETVAIASDRGVWSRLWRSWSIIPPFWKFKHFRKLIIPSNKSQFLCFIATIEYGVHSDTSMLQLQLLLFLCDNYSLQHSVKNILFLSLFLC